MDVRKLSAAELLERLTAPAAAPRLLDLSGLVLLVGGDATLSGDDLAALAREVAMLPCVIVGIHEPAAPEPAHLAPVCDLVLPEGDPALDAVLGTVGRNPLSAMSLALLLRSGDGRSVVDGLLAESAVYSTLQAGPEFAAWRRSRVSRDRPQEAGPALTTTRHGDRLEIVLRRPATRNALNAQMRDELLEALAVPVVDRSVEEVHLRGEGPSFCSGGDLDEFGTFPDQATAHLIRVAASVGRVISALADRVVVHLHGACIGSGIELPAFAQRVLARPDTSIALPEVGFGLIPGAGGTVSLPRRIGRHRTARLALTATPVDAGTALEWGLVDAIET